jgi:hypothetical protein
MDFPLNFSTFSRDYPVKEGDIFAWRRDEQSKGILEALIRIRKITPVGIPDAPKSSAPKEEIPVKEAGVVDKTNQGNK